MKEKLTREQYMKELTGKDIPQSIELKTVEEKKDKKICYIIGTANSRSKAPYDTTNPNAQFWGVGHCLLLSDIRRLDKVFELHLPYIYNSEISPFSQKPILYHANKEYALHGRTTNVHCVLQREDKNINDYEVFNRNYLKEKYMGIFPPSDAFYATNSIAWMILQAIDEGFEEIHLYGIHLETTGEWAFERPCNELWLGFFMGMMWERGIKTNVVYLPEDSDVLRGYHEYGFADIEVRRKKIQGKIEMDNKVIEDIKNQRIFTVNELNKLQGELNITIEKKVEWLKEQINLFSKELDVINSHTKEDYDKIIKDKIIKTIQQHQINLQHLDARLNAFSGAKDRTEYFLNELNA